MQFLNIGLKWFGPILTCWTNCVETFLAASRDRLELWHSEPVQSHVKNVSKLRSSYLLPIMDIGPGHEVQMGKWIQNFSGAQIQVLICDPQTLKHNF